MNVLFLFIWSLAFIGGCGVRTFFEGTSFPWLAAVIMLGLGAIGAGLIPFRLMMVNRWVWLMAGLIGAFATFYIQFRVPQPLPNDISKLAPLNQVTIRGELLDSPMTSGSGRGKFTLAAREIKLSSGEQKSVEGKLYVTTPLTQVTGLRPSQSIAITGNLYLPQPPNNPSGFDFKAFLGRSGIFAGLSGKSLKVLSDPPIFGDWWIRNRIVRTHVTGAGMPEGALLSSLVLGNRTIDLPSDIKQTFIEVGLAAALAASGFQVSIILGTVLAITSDNSNRLKFIAGTISLVGFLLLTGVSPSVLRAVVMGMGTLTGLVIGRQIRPVVGLTLAAMILLIIQPLWIKDLGFQLSFLATLGLVVSAGAIAKKLEWLPPLLATLLAVPIAAYFWTLPLQLYAFGKISAYSILANVLTTPLVSLGTIVGIVSGLLGIFFVPLGAVISWLLTAPMSLMIAIANGIRSLPGAITNAGSIALWQVLLGYGIILGIWLVPRVKKLWLPFSVIFLMILFIPGAITRSSLFQALVISSDRTPVMLIQDQGKVALINSGDQQIANFTLVPLFQKVGINQIDWAIATGSERNISAGWQVIKDKPIPIKNFASSVPISLTDSLADSGASVTALKLNQPLEFTNQSQIELINQSPNLIRIQTADTSWLLMTDAKPTSQKQLLNQAQLLPKLKAKIFWWTGEDLIPELLEAVQPTTAIASTSSQNKANQNKVTISADTISKLKAANIDFYQTNTDGAISWTNNQVQALKDRDDTESPI
ncbi:ComEC/Rec2-related protein [Synechococcus sp. PCC 7502]|uniref:ComEC/Rec2 family competence protein n=1 Tax=Synechococcus sp. PCC 7502 TaxID=1173263 RepID=UPI00029F89F5|nr:ComEC/Rec2 family competence protein [Synechococcus sp. PCC 7502]AFY72929.1 ComEC/Rec2-related protein [Synechococcus sp. PCC 7502]